MCQLASLRSFCPGAIGIRCNASLEESIKTKLYPYTESFAARVANSTKTVAHKFTSKGRIYLELPLLLDGSQLGMLIKDTLWKLLVLFCFNERNMSEEKWLLMKCKYFQKYWSVWTLLNFESYASRKNGVLDKI